MSITAARRATDGLSVPRNMRIIGWIDRHPTHTAHQNGLTVLLTGRGIECGWTGRSLINLPSGYRSKVEFVAID